MKPWRLVFPLVLALLQAAAGFPPALAAEARDFEAFGKLVRVERTQDGRQIGLVLYGQHEGIVRGERLLIYGWPSDGGIDEVGFARIDSLGADHAVLQVTGERTDSIAVGDMVELRARSVWPEDGVITMQLAAYAVTLCDVEWSPILDPATLMADPGSANDDSTIAALSRAIRDIMPMLTEFPDLKPIIPGGRFAGLSGFEAMSAITADDTRDFLNYVRSYPGKYVGQRYRMAESYAAWVMSEAPISAWEAIDRYPGLGEAEREAYVLKHREAFLADKTCENWYRDARDLYKHGEKELALRIMELFGEAAGVIEDEWFKHLYYSASGDVLSWEGQYEEAAEALRLAIVHARGDSADIAVIHHTLGTVHESLERWRDAIVNFENALRWKGALDDPFANRLSATTFWALGRCHHELEEFETAASHLLTAAQVLATDPSLDELEATANIYSLLGDVYDSMGRYDKAIAAWRLGRLAAEKLGWRETMADALADVSDGHWNLGDLREAVAAREEVLAIALEIDDEEREARAYVNLGELHYRLGEMETAQRRFAAALAIYDRLEMRWDLGDTHRRLGDFEKHRGDVPAALAEYERAVAIFAETESIASLATTYISLGETVGEQGLVEKGGEYFELARASRAADGDRAGQAEALRYWGSMLFDNRDPIGSRARFQASLELYEEIGDLEGQADVHRINSDLIANFEGDPGRAIAEAETALRIAREMGSKYHVAMGLITLGNRQSTTGAMDAAFAGQREALALFEEIEDSDGVIMGLLALGGLYEIKGDYARSMAHYKRARDVADASDLPSRKADALASIAWQLYVEGRNEEARARAEEALVIHRGLGSEWLLSRHHTTLGSVAQREGLMEESLRHHAIASDYDEAWNNLIGQAANLNNIGQVHHALRDYETAADYYLRSLELSERLRYTDAIIATVGNLAECYQELGRADDALAYIDRSLAIAREAGAKPRVAEVGRLRAKLLRKAGRHADAGTALAELRGVVEELGSPLLLLRFEAERGILAWASGDFDGARRELVAVIARGEEFRMPLITAEPLLYLGRARRDGGDDEGAIASFRAAIERLEQVGGGLSDEAARARFQAQHGEAYTELIALLGALGRHEEAFEVLGLMKSQELRELGGRGLAGVEDEEDRAKLQRAEGMLSREALLLRKLQTEYEKPTAQQRADLLEAWEAELDSIVFAFADFVAGLKDEQPELYGRLEIEPVGFHQLQAGLEPGEVFIEPLLLPDRIVIFVVRGGSDPLLVREVPVAAARVDSLVREMRASLGRPEKAWEGQRAKLAMRADRPRPADPTAAAEALHALLIEPILGDLHGVETLVISPSGRLRYIPFAALYDGESYLIDRYRSCVLTKAGVLADRQPIGADASILAFCNPDSSLRGAEREVRRLEQTWEKPRITAYCGDDATKRRLRRELSGHDIVHLATHGVLLNNNPQGSYLLLAGDEDGSNLTFREIMLLPLQGVGLAVLSACETAVGDHGEGKEIAGLAYNFQNRGTAAVIATLWAVDDESTADLMAALYESLRGGGSSRLASLHRAQLALRESEAHAHPYYWAPFILIGSWR